MVRRIRSGLTLIELSNQAEASLGMDPGGPLIKTPSFYR